MQGALKVGLLVCVFAALFVGAYAILGKSVFAPKTTRYYAAFEDAGGVTVGSRVLLAGVTVGKVGEVKLIQGVRARLALDLEEGVQVPTGTVAVLPTALIGIGDRQIELTPPPKATGFVEVGATLPGRIRTPLEAMMPESGATMAELNKTLQATQKLLGDEGLKAKLSALLESGADTAEKFGNLASRLDQTVVQNQATIRAAMTSSSAIVEDLRVVSNRLASYAKSGKLEGQVDTLMVALNQTIKNGDALVSDMRSLMNDPQLRGDMSAIVANTKTMTESGTKMAASGEKIMENGVTISAKVIEISEKASLLADDARALIQHLKGTIGRLPTGGGIGKIDVGADVFRESNPNRWRTEVEAAVPIGKLKLHVGVWDAFESNKLNLQMGRQFVRDGEFRYGVFASKPGVGVDFPVASKLKLRGDVFGVNNPRFDLRARYEFGGGIIGWVGLERVFDRNAPSIGIGVRR